MRVAASWACFYRVFRKPLFLAFERGRFCIRIAFQSSPCATYALRIQGFADFKWRTYTPYHVLKGMMDPFGQAISLVGIENDRNNPNGMEVNPEVSEWDWHGAGMKLTSSVAENLKGKLADKESEKEGRVCYIYADISIGWDINGNKGGMRILYMSKDNVLGSTDNPIKFMPSVGSGHYDGDPQQLTEEGIRNIHSSRRTVGTTRGDINISATYCILCFCSQDNADWYLNKARINSNPEYDEDTNRLRHNSLTNKLYNRDNLAQFHLPVEDCGIESAHINFDWTEGSYDKNAGQYINVTTEVNNY